MSSKYQELSEKLAANHANCEEIEKELEQHLPDEMFVLVFKKEHRDDDGKHYAYTTEKAALKTFASLTEKVVRYVLPPGDGEKSEDGYKLEQIDDEINNQLDMASDEYAVNAFALKIQRIMKS